MTKHYNDFWAKHKNSEGWIVRIEHEANRIMFYHMSQGFIHNIHGHAVYAFAYDGHESLACYLSGSTPIWAWFYLAGQLIHPEKYPKMIR